MSNLLKELEGMARTTNELCNKVRSCVNAKRNKLSTINKFKKDNLNQQFIEVSELVMNAFDSIEYCLNQHKNDINALNVFSKSRALKIAQKINKQIADAKKLIQSELKVG